MLAEARNSGFRHFLSEFWKYADVILAERGQLETTIIADFVVYCRETFQVKDLSTNEIVQGDGTERIVAHVVSMERDISLVPVNDAMFIRQGNWQIVGIDDLIDKGWMGG